VNIKPGDVQNRKECIWFTCWHSTSVFDCLLS